MAEISPLDIGTLITTIVSHFFPSLEHIQHLLPMIWNTIMQMFKLVRELYDFGTEATKDTHPSVGQSDFDPAAMGFDPTEMSFLDVVSSDWFNIVIVGIGTVAMNFTIAGFWWLWTSYIKPYIEENEM